VSFLRFVVAGFGKGLWIIKSNRTGPTAATGVLARSMPGPPCVAEILFFVVKSRCVTAVQRLPIVVKPDVTQLLREALRNDQLQDLRSLDFGPPVVVNTHVPELNVVLHGPNAVVMSSMQPLLL